VATSLFGVGGTVNVNVSGTLIPQSFTATAGQTLFTLSGFTYTPSTSSLLVFINGQRQVIGRDFTETSSSSFTLVEGCVVGDYVDVIGFPQTDLTAVTAGSVIYTPTGTGGYPRAAQAKFGEFVTLTDYGAVGNGAANCGTALQKAHDALPGVGGTIYIPACASYYLFTTGVTFTKYVRLVFDGIASTPFYTTTAGLVMISSSAKLDINNGHFLAYGAARTTAIFIKHLSTAAGHGNSTIENCLFDGGVACYWSQRTNALQVRGCSFGPQAGSALLLENIINSDEGDSFITNNTFGGVAGVTSILVLSTAGLYISANKFNGAASAHLLISNTTHNVGDNTITGNSFEGQTDYAIQIVGTSGVSVKNLITGNQFSSTSTNYIILGIGAQFTTITGNSFNNTSSASGTGILVSTSSKEIAITGNLFYNILNGISCTVAQNFGITISGNRFADTVTYPFQGDNGSEVVPIASNKEIIVARYFSEAAGTLTAAYRFQGRAYTLEIIAYGTTQGVGNTAYHRKVAVINDTTVVDINAAVNQGTALTVALNNVGGFLELQAAKSAGTSFTGYVEVYVRGQCSYIKKV
jgi:hypothetical protein